LEVPWTQDIPMDPCTRMLDFESVIYTIPPFTTLEGDLHDHFGQGLSFVPLLLFGPQPLDVGAVTTLVNLLLLLPFIHIFLHQSGLV